MAFLKHRLSYVLIIIVVAIAVYVFFAGKTNAPSPVPSASLTFSNSVSCKPEDRKGDVCAEIYAPVCAQVEVQCIKAPCYPVPQTFGNVCEACHNALVSSYVPGACE